MAAQIYQWVYRFVGLPISDAVTVWDSAGAAATTGISDEFGAFEVELPTGRYFATNLAGTALVGPVTQSEPATDSVVAAYAADHVVYVSTTGSDSNDGSSWGSACATVPGAFAKLGNSPGTIQIGYGTFTFSTQMVFSGAVGLRINGSGKWGGTVLQPTAALSGLSGVKLINCRDALISNLQLAGTGVPGDTYTPLESTANFVDGAYVPNVVPTALSVIDVLFGSLTDGSSYSIAHAIRWSLNGTGTTPLTTNDVNNDHAKIVRCTVYHCGGPAFSIEHRNSVHHIFDACVLVYVAGLAIFKGGSASFISPTVNGTSPVTGAYMFDFQPAAGGGTPRYTHGTYVWGMQSEATGLALVRNQSTVALDVADFVAVGGHWICAGMSGSALGVNYIEWTPTANAANNRCTFIACDLSTGQAGLVCNIASANSHVTFERCDLGIASFVNNGVLTHRGVVHAGGTVTITNTKTLIEANVEGGSRTTLIERINGVILAGSNDPTVQARGLLTASAHWEAATGVRAFPGVGQVWAVKVPWLVSNIISNIGLSVATVGVSLTGCCVFAYDAALNLLVYSADTSTSMQSLGVKTYSAANGPQAGVAIPAQAAGYIWLGIKVDGGTPPAFNGAGTLNAPTQYCGALAMAAGAPLGTLPSLTSNALFPYMHAY
jgi:energy-converting hydrogenase Eha subunit E